MGFLDALAGRSSRKSPAEDVTETEPASQATTSGLNASELLRDAAPPPGLGAAFDTPSTRLYDPYQGLGQQLGGKKVVYQLPEGPQFVFQEEAAVHRRGWGENLQFYTGLGYLGGGATGFAIGGYRFLHLPKDPALDTAKLRANRLLNTSGSIGRQMACGSAVLGLYFSISESLLINLVDGGAPDAACTIAAGFGTAALYRAPRGPRAAAISGAVGALVGSLLVGLRQYFPSM